MRWTPEDTAVNVACAARGAERRRDAIDSCRDGLQAVVMVGER